MREWSINDDWPLYHRIRQKLAKVSAVHLSHVRRESLVRPRRRPSKSISHVFFRLKIINKSISMTNPFLGIARFVFQKSPAQTAFWTYIRTGYNLRTSLHLHTIHFNGIHNGTPYIVRLHNTRHPKAIPGPPEAPPPPGVCKPSPNL
jgi:hypothetical protein